MDKQPFSQTAIGVLVLGLLVAVLGALAHDWIITARSASAPGAHTQAAATPLNETNGSPPPQKDTTPRGPIVRSASCDRRPQFSTQRLESRGDDKPPRQRRQYGRNKRNDGGSNSRTHRPKPITRV